jgi:hypothetical protein
MTPPMRIGTAAAVAAAATFGISGVAGATAGQKSFTQTFPLASHVCAATAEGKGPKRMRASAASVLVDCATLQGNFTADRTAVVSAVSSITQARANERAAITASCAGALAHKPSCAHARSKHVKALVQLARQRHQAVHTYYHSVEAARRAFWTAIRALPGGAALREDPPVRELSS